MIRWLGLLLVALIVLSSQGMAQSASTVSPSNNWTATQGNASVPLGSPIQILVSGPPKGNFTVSIEGEPFNHTYPSIVRSYDLPTSPNGTNQTAMTVAIPTRLLTFGGYLVEVNNTTVPFTFGLFVYYVVLPVNLTSISQNLTYLWQLYNVTLKRQIGLAAQQQTDERLIEEQFWVSVILFILMTFMVVVTRTSIAQRRLGRVVSRFFHRLLYRRRDSDPWTSGSASAPTPVPEADPARTWVSRLFPRCDACATPNTESGVFEHLRGDHRLLNPSKDRGDYEQLKEAIRIGVETRPDYTPDPARVDAALKAIPDSAFQEFPKGA